MYASSLPLPLAPFTHAPTHADERIQAPFTLPTPSAQVRSKPTKPATRAASASATLGARGGAGTTQLAFNTSGTLLLVRSAALPTAVLLYDFPLPSHSPAASQSTSALGAPLVPRLRTVLLHTQPVSTARWNPDPARAGRLAVACASQSVYLWSDEWVPEPSASPSPSPPSEEDGEVAECVGVPAQKFETRDVRWAPDGKGMVLLDDDTFCCAFEVEEEGQDGDGDTPGGS